MYTNYNIPQNRNYKPTNYYRGQSLGTTTTYYNDGDRFFGGGFLAPFLLGGVGGYLIGRPNQNSGYQQGPIPVYFPPQPAPYPYPMPYSSNTNIYY